MKNRTGIVSLIIGIIIIIAAALVWSSFRGSSDESSANAPVAAQYACDAGKTIAATFYQGQTIPSASSTTPPTPGGSATVVLSDGRTMDLHQTISADGVRYANADDSFVFWSKGQGALVLENNQEKSYIGCVSVKPDLGTTPNVYQNGTEGWSIRYPAGYTVDESYVNQSRGPGKDIHGTKFTIPSDFAKGTNLSSDSYMSIEEIPRASECSASLFLPSGVESKDLSDGSTDYSVATSSDAAAGNRYEETVYALPGTNPCVGVRYFIHYGVYENYPAGTVARFDRVALLAQFDAMRRTLTVVR